MILRVRTLGPCGHTTVTVVCGKRGGIEKADHHVTVYHQPPMVMEHRQPHQAVDAGDWRGRGA